MNRPSVGDNSVWPGDNLWIIQKKGEHDVELMLAMYSRNWRRKSCLLLEIDVQQRRIEKIRRCYANSINP